MGTSFFEAFLSCRGLQHFVPSSPEDRLSQEEEFRVIVDNEYFTLIIYIPTPY
jgi:hypothetical protein